ncbi:MAG TPA: hypothetical protein VFF67_03140 [Thermoplasmata archaeon]|nr:hypothetical protein [Thermoplasmata archaeon]
MAALAILSAAAPLVGASQTLAPPFRHTLALQTKTIQLAGSCPDGASLSKVKWVPTTGNMTGLATASARSCGVGPYGNGYANVFARNQLYVLFPLHVTSGVHNVSVSISFSSSVYGTVAGTPKCPYAVNVPGKYSYGYCNYDIAAELNWGEVIFDATNSSSLTSVYSSVVGPENFSSQYNDSYCNGNGGCYFSNGSSACIPSPYYYTHCVPWGSAQSGTNTTWINTGNNCVSLYNHGHCGYWNNWTLNGSHSLWVEVAFVSSVWASVYGYPGLHVSAQCNSASLGNTGWKITSVKVT